MSGFVFLGGRCQMIGIREKEVRVVFTIIYRERFPSFPLFGRWQIEDLTGWLKLTK